MSTINEADLRVCMRELQLAAQPEAAGVGKYYDFYRALGLRRPSRLLQEAILQEPPQKIQILNGLRGNGKTTELFQLKQALTAHAQFELLYINLLDYHDTTQPVEINRLLIIVAAAVTDLLLSESDQKWQRFWHWFEKSVQVSLGGKASLKIGPASVELSPKIWLKEQGVIDAIGKELKNKELNIQAQVNEYLKQLQAEMLPNKTLVLLIDSLEQLHDIGLSNERPVQRSQIELYTKQLARISFPSVITVWTAPPTCALIHDPAAGQTGQAIPWRSSPYISVVATPDLQATSSPEPLRPNPTGLQELCKTIKRLSDNCTQIFSDELLMQAAWFSSGNIRAALRILQESMVNYVAFEGAKSIDQALNYTLNSLRQNVALADDAKLLAHIRQQHKLSGFEATGDHLVTNFGRMNDNAWIAEYQSESGQIWYAPSRLVDFDDAMRAWSEFVRAA